MFRSGSRRDHDTGPAPEALRLVKVTKTYGTGGSAVTALDGVTLGLRRGTFTAVMGPSGSGKSTLLRCAAGLDRPDSGIVQVDGTELTGGSEAQLTRFRRGRIGFVFQQYNLLETLTVAQNTVLPLKLAGRRIDRRRAREILTAVGLGDRLGHRTDQLSGGQRQRVAIARALVTEPRVIFADEPTGALDTRSARDVLRVLQEAARVHGSTVVMVTHDPLAASHADTVQFLADGRLAGRMDAPTPDPAAERLAHLGDDVTQGGLSDVRSGDAVDTATARAVPRDAAVRLPGRGGHHDVQLAARHGRATGRRLRERADPVHRGGRGRRLRHPAGVLRRRLDAHGERAAARRRASTAALFWGDSGADQADGRG